MNFIKIGTATTLIGDPTGRNREKEVLSHSEILRNSTSITRQIQDIYENGMKINQIMNFKPIKIIDNLSWFKDMELINFLSDFGRFVKVKSMLSRNWYLIFFQYSYSYIYSVQSRLDSEDGLNFCEFSYQLMQGYDFYHLRKHFGVNVQVIHYQ